jgi:hypothetical protein
VDRHLSKAYPVKSSLRSRGEEKWLLELQLWVVSCGASLCIDLDRCGWARAAGVVDRLLIDPRHSYFEASITDGTGFVTARWSIGLSALCRAVVPGRRVIVEGFVLESDRGIPILVDPRYEVISRFGVA